MKQENYSSHCAGDQRVPRKKSAVLAISLGLLVGSLTAMQNVWAGCDIVTDGLVACYPFDGNANDESGNGNHGTEYGGLKYVAGKFEQAASFDGVNDYVQVPLNSTLKFNPNTSPFTLMAWARPKSVNDTDGAPTIWSCQLPWAPFLDTYTYFLSNQGIEGKRSSSNQGGAHLNSPVWDEMNWHLFIGTWAIENGKVVSRFYVDGQLMTTNTFDSIPGGSYPWTNLLIGATHHCRDGSFSNLNFSETDLDEARIYNRALTEDEIKKLYEPPLPAKCDDPAKRARYSYKTGRVNIPFTDVPLLEETSPNATGDTAVFKGLRLRLNADQDFEIVDPSAKPDDTGEPVGDPCHAVYTYENRTLKITAVEVPTVLATFPTIKEGKPISVYEVLLQHVQVTPIDLGFLHLQEAQLIEVIE